MRSHSLRHLGLALIAAVTVISPLWPSLSEICSLNEHNREYPG
jgi:hypothetical protein